MTDILLGYRSDHSIVTLKLKFGKDIKHKLFGNSIANCLKIKIT